MSVFPVGVPKTFDNWPLNLSRVEKVGTFANGLPFRPESHWLAAIFLGGVWTANEKNGEFIVLKHTQNFQKNLIHHFLEGFPSLVFPWGLVPMLRIDFAQAESAIRFSRWAFNEALEKRKAFSLKNISGMMFFPPLWGWYSSWMGWLRICFGFWIGLCGLVVWFNRDEFRRGSAFCGDSFYWWLDLTDLFALSISWLSCVNFTDFTVFFTARSRLLFIGAFLTEFLSANQRCDDRLLAVRLWQIHIQIWYICTSLCIQLSCLTKYMCIV